jgi:hypothetical protein
MTKVLKQEGFSGGMGFSSHISDDGHTVTLPISASQLPPQGSDQIKVVGTIKLSVGSDPKTESVNFAPKAETKLKLAATNKSLDYIQSIKFLDGKNEIESSQQGKSSLGLGEQTTHSISYMLKAKPKTVTAQVTYFGATKQVDVPVNLSVGLSLEAK